MIPPLRDLSRLCVHTMTTQPWPLAEAVVEFVRAGVPAISVWRQALQPYSLAEARQILDDSGLRVTSLCRGGFFPALDDAGRKTAIDDNRRAIEEAAAIGAPIIVLVPGAVPGIPLSESRKQITDGIAAVLPDARAAGVTLAVEPLHPMYADSRSAINTVAQANDIIDQLGESNLGIALDVYHVWWDANLETDIKRAGKRIVAFHVCDWRTPTRDLLTDRGLMGDGCIPIRSIREMVEAAGYNGDIEVEIFSEAHWAEDQRECLERICTAYLEHV